MHVYVDRIIKVKYMHSLKVIFMSYRSKKRYLRARAHATAMCVKLN